MKSKTILPEEERYSNETLEHVPVLVWLYDSALKAAESEIEEKNRIITYNSETIRLYEDEISSLKAEIERLKNLNK